MKPGVLDGVFAWTFLASTCFGWLRTNAANRDPVVDAVPEEAALVLVVEDVSHVREDFLRTEFGRFLLDPAVKCHKPKPSMWF